MQGFVVHRSWQVFDKDVSIAHCSSLGVSFGHHQAAVSAVDERVVHVSECVGACIMSVRHPPVSNAKLLTVLCAMKIDVGIAQALAADTVAAHMDTLGQLKVLL